MCPILFDWFENRTHSKMDVRFCSIAERNRTPIVRLDFCMILFDKITQAFTVKAKTVAVIKTYLFAWDRYPVESDIRQETSGQQKAAGYREGCCQRKNLPS